MGRLTNLNPSKPLTEADMPSGMATDIEATAAATAAINAHVAAADPHTQYLTQARGDARVTVGINAHVAAADPHTQYLTQARGDARVTVGINAHVAAADPHTQYLTQAEADELYRQTSVAYFSTAPLPPGNVAGNSIAFGWNSVQSGQGIAELCNYAGLGGGDAFNFFRMGGNPTTPPTLSNRVARIDISGSYVQTSDERVKSAFSQAPGLDAIMALKPMTYLHWSVNGFNESTGSFELGTSKPKIGFVAQQVASILPQAVSVPSSEEELWGIDYNCILACAVQAIRDLKLEVDQLKKEVVELRSQVPA
jgi:hypothetical protein